MEKAIFVSVQRDEQTRDQVNEYLDELAFLAETAGVVGDKQFVQRMVRPDSRTYVGSGKLNELKETLAALEKTIGEYTYVVGDADANGNVQVTYYMTVMRLVLGTESVKSCYF